MTGLMFPKPVVATVAKAAASAAEARWWEVLKALVAYRDEGRCRCCGQRGRDPHHLQFRSLCGRDETSNVVWLCRTCHEQVQAHRIACAWANANWPRGVVFGRAAQAPDVEATLATAAVPCATMVVIDREYGQRAFEYPIPLPEAITIWRQTGVRRLLPGLRVDTEGRVVYVELPL